MNSLTTAQFSSLFCVAMMLAAGNLLFKAAAHQIELELSLLEVAKTFLTWQFFLALTLYGLGTLLWIVILVDVPLTRAYPFMVLPFALVPVGAHFIYREAVQPSYWLGVAFLLVGLYIISTNNQ